MKFEETDVKSSIWHRPSGPLDNIVAVGESVEDDPFCDIHNN